MSKRAQLGKGLICIHVEDRFEVGARSSVNLHPVIYINDGFGDECFSVLSESLRSLSALTYTTVNQA